MNGRAMLASATGAALCVALGFGLGFEARAGSSGSPSAESSPSIHSAASTAPALPSLPAARLEFREFFEPGTALKPSAKVLGLSGQRVRLVGFMAQMELPPKGGFFLAPRRVRCDEAGGGTADLPLEALFVVMKSAGNEPVPYLAEALEVSGILEVGNHADAEGRVTSFRLMLDAPSAQSLKTARGDRS